MAMLEVEGGSGGEWHENDLVLYHGMFDYCLYKSLHYGSHLGSMCIKYQRSMRIGPNPL